MKHLGLLCILFAVALSGCEAKLNGSSNNAFDANNATPDTPLDSSDQTVDVVFDTPLDVFSDERALDAQSDEVEDQAQDNTDDSPDIPDMTPQNFSAGCGGTPGLPEGEQTFTLDGLERRYVVRLPRNYDQTRAWPLVLALHGNGGTPSYWDGTSGDRDLRSVVQDDAILIIPAAIDKQWKDYSLSASESSVRLEQELVYFDRIIERAKSDLCINTDAIFSMGFSGGGSYSGVLSCRRDDIRAIAVGGSVVYFNEDNCVGKSAAWVAISEDDFGAARERYLNFFRDRVSCAPTSQATPPAQCVSYDTCEDGYPVHYCTHPGGHRWPDFGAQGMWDFFAQFVTP